MKRPFPRLILTHVLVWCRMIQHAFLLYICPHTNPPSHILAYTHIHTAISMVDTDGDGEITAADIRTYWAKAKAVLSHAVPSAGGFAGGFALGVYYG